MIVNINDIEFTNEVLEKLYYTITCGATEKSIRTKEKFIKINFDEVDMSRINLDGLNTDYLYFMLDYVEINDKEFYIKLFEYLEKDNDALWIRLVEWGLISDKVFQANTYEENIYLLFRHRYKDE